MYCVIVYMKKREKDRGDREKTVRKRLKKPCERFCMRIVYNIPTNNNTNQTRKEQQQTRRRKEKEEKIFLR